MADDKTSEVRGTGKLEEQVTLHEQTVPDSETSAHPEPEAYDYEFEYLAPASPKSGAPKNEVVPASPKGDGQPASEDKGDKKEEAQPKTEETPDYPVPPIAAVKKDGEGAPKSETKEAPKSVEYEQRYRDLQSLHDKSMDEKVKEIERLNSELSTLQGLRTFKEELEKNPLGVLQQHFPQLADKVSPRRVITDTLAKEFGAELDAYNANEAMQEGTTSYRIREREDELRAQMQRSQLEAESHRLEETRRREVFFNEQKERVKKEFGMDDKTYDTEILGWAKEQPPIGPYQIARLKYFDWFVKNAVAQALASSKKGNGESLPASIASVGGESEGAEPSREAKELQDEFGDLLIH
jgi:hypothetical protein